MGKRLLVWTSLAVLGVLHPLDLSAQDRRIMGTVVQAATGDPIAAAEVSVGAGFAATLTNEEGRFVLTAPAGEVRIQVRAFGYQRVEVTVPADQNTVQISMETDVFRMDELVVTGQATSIERRAATTAIEYVSGEDLTKVPASSVLGALTGKVSGVNLQANSGAPGGGMQMQIRGNATILGAYDPLYVVDGVIYSNASIPSGRGHANNAAIPSMEADAVNRIADLNPADIESIEILKGAAASSIYGSKASNGVVVIKTKRGTVGEPRIRVTQRVGVSAPSKLLESRRWDLDSALEAFGEPARQFFQGNSSPHFDHYDMVYSNRSLSHETLADISGGTETTQYYVSGSYSNEEGTERNTGAGRQSLRMNLNQTLSPRVNLEVSSAFTRSENDRGWNNNCNNYGCHGYAMAYIPGFVDFSVKNPDGSYPDPAVGPPSNPLQLTELGVNHEETNRFVGGATLRWNAYSSSDHDVQLVAAGGVDAFDQQNDVWTPNDLFFEQVQSLPGESIESGGRNLNWNWNLNALHTWHGGFFTANTSAGLQYEDQRLHTSFIRTQNLLPGQRNVNQGTNITAEEHLVQERTLALYVQEALRLFDDRLLLQAGLRAERSSVNGDAERYYVFPKVSSSYQFRELMGEGSLLKLRVAYGETGNQPLFGQKYTTLGTPQLGGQQGITVATSSGYDNVEPERLKEIEGGIDGELMDGRVNWTLTGFSRSTTNLLLERVPAPSSGFSEQIFNGGEIRNSGVEIGLGYSPILETDRSWIMRGTFTRYTSEVVDLAGLPAFFPPGSGFGSLGQTRVEVGQPITQIVGFDWDENGERTEVMQQLGNSAPDFRIGFTNDLSYKSLSLSMVVDWQHGGDVINLTQFLYDDAQNSADWGSAAWEERYQGYLNGVIRPYIEDGSFVKLREVQVGVDLPASILGPVNAETLRVGLTGRNLYTWTDYSGVDPEVSNFGAMAIRNNLDIAPYPPARTFFFNVTVGF